MLRPNEARAKYAIVMLFVILFLDVVFGYSSYLQLGLLNDLNEGIFVPDDVLTTNDLRERIIGVLYSIAMLVSAVFFIQWFRRAYYNLQTLYKSYTGFIWDMYMICSKVTRPKITTLFLLVLNFQAEADWLLFDRNF